jgi:6-pyruvoyl-tetrahydropterin synthase related domain
MNPLRNSKASGRPESALREWAAAAGVSLLVALAVVSPFFFLGIASGHDIAFHMASWLDAAGQWKQGIFLPRWAEWANFGYGEPRFIFYPPLSWLLGALLGCITPWSAVATAFVVCVQGFAGISAYLLLRSFLNSRSAALLGAACFASNPYALMIVYARSDFAELLAMAFLPLLFLATFRLCGFLEAQGDPPGAVRERVAFAGSFAGVWLSNAPAAVIATYSVAFVFVFAAARERSLKRLVAGGSAILLGFGLASFYIIPAIYEQRWVNIGGALAGGLTPAENFLYARTTDAEHDAFNRVASNVAVLLVVWATVGGIAAFWAARGRMLRSKRALIPVAVLAGIVFLFMLPVTTMLWRFLPELRFVQFPWRWMSVLALCAVLFVTTAARDRAKWIWAIAAILSVAGSGGYLIKHTWWDTEDMPTLEAALANGEGFEGTDEYDPVGDDRTDLPLKKPRAWFVGEAGHATTRLDAQIFVDRWTAEQRTLRVVAAQNGHVAIRLLDYPAWRVAVSGKPWKTRHAAGTAQMIISVPPGESRIEITFTRTLDRTLGGWISVLSVCASIALLVSRRRSPTGEGARD